MATATPNAPTPVDRDRQGYSADGVNWGGVEMIPWDRSTVPVPGGDPNSTSFHLRVDGDSAVDGEVYLGNWSIERGSAWFRVDVDGVDGQSVTLDADDPRGPGVLMSEFEIPANDSVMLTLNVGIPFSEVEQGAQIAPDWGIVLRELGGSGGGGSGSIGSGSLGSSGGSSAGSSAGSNASGGSSAGGSSAGSSAGSTGTISIGSLGAPLLNSR